MMLLRLIPSSFIRWAENLPEWGLMTIVGFVIVLVLVTMWLVIRKVNTNDSPAAPKTMKPKPPANPSPQPVQPTPAPVQPAATAVSELSSDNSRQPTAKKTPSLDASIYNRIASLGGANKSVLFAGAGLEHLPVTIPVQTAVKLAGSGKKILLIDLDMKRNAIVKVFDPGETSVKTCTRPKPQPTPVQNLWFWPADFFIRFAQMNLRAVIQSALAEFNLVLIYAPYLDGHPDRKLIASCAKCGLIFCKTKQQFERLQALMAMGECQLLESKPIEC